MNHHVNPKKSIFFFTLFIFCYLAQAQVGIGTTSPASGALLDISSTDKGILIPRVNILDLSTQAPVSGDLTNSESLMVYNTNTTTGKGFYYWNGTQWIAVGGGDDTNIYNKSGTLTETRTVNLDEHTLKFDNGIGRYLNLIGASVSDNDSPFLFTTGNSIRFDVDNLPVLTLDYNQLIGVGTDNPKDKLHVAGNSSTIRVDGLSNINNIENVTGDPMPVYVDGNGAMILQPSLVQTFMPVNSFNFINNFTELSSNGPNNGDLTNTNIVNATINLTQESLVEIIYHISVTVANFGGSSANDGAPRLFRSYIVNNNNRVAYDTGTYAQAGATGGSTIANGFYYLNGSGYYQLPAGTHTFTLVGEGYGGDYGFRLRFGETNQERIQVIVHR